MDLNVNSKAKLLDDDIEEHYRYLEGCKKSNKTQKGTRRKEMDIAH